MKETILPTPDAKHAWSDLPAEDLAKRPVGDRIHDFGEVERDFDETAAQAQATRCVQCVHPGCVDECPVGSPIDQWMQLVAEGRFAEAAALARDANAIPEICARLCPRDHLCERGCVLGGPSEPVCIGALEQFLQDYSLAGAEKEPVLPPNGKQVAVVGAGAAGLACADELSRRGYSVTIFDSGGVPGGALVRGTAAFRLDPAIVRRRIEILRQRGVVFSLNAALGREVTLAGLRVQFGAVFVGLEARQARMLQVPGAHLAGVVDGLAFMAEVTGSTPPDFGGRRVVVVGSDDLAIDCARSAVRCNAVEVRVVTSVAEGALSCARRDYDDAVEEGVLFQYQMVPVALVGNDAGQVTGYQAVRVATLTEGDQRGARLGLVHGEEADGPADRVIVAMGFDRHPAILPGDFVTLAADGHGEVLVDDDQMTCVGGVFAGGDLVRGPSSVVHAIRDARRAAAGIERFFGARGAC